ncbi:MAG: hypothetical protein AAB214_21890, partial [Fibrobacterota bacterium]
HRLRLPVPFSRYEIRASSSVDPVQLGGDRKAIQSIASKLRLLQDGVIWKTGSERRPHVSITNHASVLATKSVEHAGAPEAAS